MSNVFFFGNGLHRDEISNRFSIHSEHTFLAFNIKTVLSVCIITYNIYIYIGELPLTANLSSFSTGTYTFNVLATDIFRLNDTFIIEYTSE